MASYLAVVTSSTASAAVFDAAAAIAVTATAAASAAAAAVAMAGLGAAAAMLLVQLAGASAASAAFATDASIAAPAAADLGLDNIVLLHLLQQLHNAQTCFVSQGAEIFVGSGGWVPAKNIQLSTTHLSTKETQQIGGGGVLLIPHTETSTTQLCYK